MRLLTILLVILTVAGSAVAQVAINAAISPGARSGTINTPVTVFAVMQNFGDADATNCTISINEGFSGDAAIELNFQTTNASNQLTGTRNQPADINAGSVQNFLIEITGTNVVLGRDIGFDFACDQASAPLFSGVNSLRLNISETLQPDLIPIAVTLSGDGIMKIDQAGGTSAFAVAVVNIGANGTVRVRADGGEYQWPMRMLVCETDITADCLAPAAVMVEVNFAVGQTRTFSIFAFASDRLGTPFLPQLTRSFLRLENVSGQTLAASSVALSAPEPVREFTPLDLVAARNWAQANGARALLIQRDGVTLSENYWGAGGQNIAERIFSGSKSFSCALAVAASDAGILNPDDYAWSAIGAWAPGGTAPTILEKTQIRARDLISLASGLRARVSPAGFPTFSNIYNLAINAPQDLPPASQAIYGSTGFHSFSAFFEFKTGGSLSGNTIIGGLDPANYLQTQVLDPIGAQIDSWDRDLLGKPDFAAGASMTARNWSKYGRLLIDEGRWQGQQILSQAGVQKCRNYYTPSLGIYGLSFWLNRPQNGTWDINEDDIPLVAELHLPLTGQIAPSAPDDYFAALGFGNMQLHMIPSERLVIVKYGGQGDQNQFFSALFAGAFDP